MESLETSLQTYKLQLDQVEAALTSSPEDAELLKLQQDLLEVIKLTCDLIKAQGAVGTSTEGSGVTANDIKSIQRFEGTLNSKKKWKVGEMCQAIWVEDNQYYDAIIESVEGDEVTVTFLESRNSEVTTIDCIKESPLTDCYIKPKKHPLSKVREYQKKKKLKKMQRFKALEEEKEVEKHKWLAFNTKAAKKGGVKKSIFASPDNVNGRVGIGTCGVSGKGMTEFLAAEKWRKGV